MKGIIFTEFLGVVEDLYGAPVVERIIESSDLPGHGAYTTVGTYDHRELIRLVTQLSKETGAPASELVRTFGQRLFVRLAEGYPHLVRAATTPFALLERIEQVIHPEVRKLYPEAELPQFQSQRDGPDTLVMIYRSPRGFADLAEGLILGCAEWYRRTIAIDREDLSHGKGTHVRFTLRGGG